MLDKLHYLCYNGSITLIEGRYFMVKNVFREHIPPRCWVGDQHKICYASREEAETAALVAEHDYGAPHLEVYHCEYGDHWHLSSSKRNLR